MGKDGGLLIGAARGGAEFSESRTAVVRPRLSSVLVGSSEGCFDSIVTLPSNVQAIESALLFATGRSPFVAIVGPSGWGKTHLMGAAARTMQVLDRESRPGLISGKEWLLMSSRVDPMAPLLVDNAQEAFSQHRTRLQFKLALERRVKAGRPTLLAFTAPKSTRAFRAFLPNYNSWIVATIESPSTAERSKVVLQMAKAESLSISESLQSILAKQLAGDGRTLEGAFKRLRLQDGKWLDARSTLRALGILNPFFVDNSNWDLREAIWSAAEGRCRTAWNKELAIYVMLRIALLSEADVAHYFEVDPSVAYAKATSFQRRIDESEDVRDLLRHFVEDVVDRLRGM